MNKQMEEHYKLTCDVASRAIMFCACKAALSEAYRVGHAVTGPHCEELRGHMHDAEKRLDKAVEELESWLKEQGAGNDV
jgi:hypothetical protein